MRKFTAAQKKDIAAVAAKAGGTIDFADIPEVRDWTGAEIDRFFRPPKRSVTIRLDSDVLDWLKSYGRGYQTKANGLLRLAMEAHRRAATESRRTR